MFQPEEVAALRNDVEDCSLVVTFGETPEKSHNFVIKSILFQKKLKNFIGPLHQLRVGLSGVPNRVEHVLVMHPFDELVGRERTRASHLVGCVLRDKVVEISDALDTPLEVRASKTFVAQVQLEDLALCFTLIFT